MAKRIVIDTDPGVDDAMALLYAAAAPDLNLVGITTVFGNTTIDQVTKNAVSLKEKFGLTATIAKGATAPLQADPPEPVTFIHGQNGLGDAVVPNDPDMTCVDERPAAEYLFNMAQQYPGELTIIALGPLTNLAQAVVQFPDMVDLVAEVVIMGGAFGFSGETGNMTPVAEANFYNDPHAADIVVKTKWPITVVGLDVTHQTLITPKDMQIIEERSDRYGAFINEISQIYMSFYQTKFGMPGFSIHDPSAVIYASSPHMFGTRKGYLRVVQEGISKGQSILAPVDRNFLINEWNSGGVQTVCEHVSAKELLNHYIETLANGG